MDLPGTHEAPMLYTTTIACLPHLNLTFDQFLELGTETAAALGEHPGCLYVQVQWADDRRSFTIAADLSTTWHATAMEWMIKARGAGLRMVRG